MLFGHQKRILKVDQLQLHGITGANDESTLAGCGIESKVAGETDLTRAAVHWIGRPGISKKPQINPLTRLQGSMQN